MNRSLLTLLAAGAVFTGQAFAQSTLVVPTIATNEEGNDISDPRFLESGDFRTQFIVASSALAPVSAVITEIGFRRDNDNSIGGLGHTIQNVTIHMSETSVDPIAMSDTFATNVTAGTQLVYTGNIVIPPYTTSPGAVAPFFSIVLDTPFALVSANGNLLIDISANDPTPFPAGVNMAIDCCLPGGVDRRIGDTGPSALVNSLSVAGNPVSGTPNSGRFGGMIPGDGFNLMAQGSGTGSGAFLIGFTQFPSPADLSIIGAPGNFLHHDVVVSVPTALVQPPIGFSTRAVQQLDVPNDPALEQLVFWATGAFMEPAANPLGLTLTNARKITLGEGPVGYNPTNQLSAAGSGSATGFIRYGTSGIVGAAPIQFVGVFN